MPRAGSAPTRRALLIALFVGAACLVACRGHAPERSLALQAVLARGLKAFPPNTPREVRSAVLRFYQQRDMRPAWEPGTDDRAIDWALDAIDTAPAHGLKAEWYQPMALKAARERLRTLEGPAQERDARVARFDVQLTTSLIWLGRDVAVGRTRGARLGNRKGHHRELPPLAERLAHARDQRSDSWPSAVEPRHEGYAALRQALEGLREQATRGGWTRVPVAVRRPRPAAADLALLDRRLTESGELHDHAATVAARAEAIRSFQNHHGIRATSRVDQPTLEALNVPIDVRIGQIALNLERWRWVSDDLGARHIRVNIPAFHLEAIENGHAVLQLRAVVGRQGDETPVLSAVMSQVVFSPYWNIPDAIAAEETIPELWRDPTFLARNKIEVVRNEGNVSEVIDPASLDWADEATLQSLAFRQRPGEGNALGSVKFLFPNPSSVYIHDTPSGHLFSRVGRAFSHGCVRIEDPTALAAYVLRDQPEWTREAIATAMRAGTEKYVKLRNGIPVHLVYFTAWVDEHGGLQFRRDVYGYDRDAIIDRMPARPLSKL
jgi:L,D-transpeptidase YcbB